MKHGHRLLSATLLWITEWGMTIGDVLSAVWLVQLVTQFEVHPSYPFTGLRGWCFIFSLYLTALICDVVRRRKFSSRDND